MGQLRQRDREEKGGGPLPLALAAAGLRPTSAQDEGEGGLLRARWAEGKMAKRAREEETAFRPETGKEGVFFFFFSRISQSNSNRI